MFIMIADDRAEERYLLKIILQGQGYTVQDFENGQQILTAAQTEPPDLIISDILMPVMDGYSLLHSIRRDERLKNTPFIFYTATYLETEDQELANKLGATSFIRKPTEPEELIHEIESVMVNQPQLEADNETPESELEYYANYSQRLVAKLEHKLVQMEGVNRLLRERSEDLRRKNQENARLVAEYQAALQVRDEFLNIAAHELRTPLTTLKGWLQVTQREITKGSQAHRDKELQHLEKAVAQARRMERLVDDMAETVEANENQLQVDLQPANLLELLQNVVTNDFLFLDQHQIKMTVPQVDNLMVKADEIKLRRALSNLLDNAIKFSMPRGEVLVEVQYSKRVGQVLISVTDNGPGISAAQREHIFTPYYQAENDSRSRQHGGLGLGLFVTKAIIEAHGGHLELVPPQPERRGTTFLINLPILEGSNPV